jgi:hypothetical protein
MPRSDDQSSRVQTLKVLLLALLVLAIAWATQYAIQKSYQRPRAVQINPVL